MKGAQLSFGEIPKVEGNSGPYAGSVGSSGDSGTSQESADKTMFASVLREKVFDLIRRDGGCTRGEMFDALAEQFQPSTLSARIRELHIAGLIEDSGTVRFYEPTKRNHAVWVKARR